MVQDCQSEAHYKHQNPIEDCVQDVKHMTSTTMDCTSFTKYRSDPVLDWYLSISALDSVVLSKPVLFALSDLNLSAHGLPTFSPDELISHTYLHKMENGELICAKVTCKILDHDAENHQRIKFLINVGDVAYEEIMAYNELSDIIEHQVEAKMHGKLDTWMLHDILAHEGPLSPHSPRYNGSLFNVRIRWSDGVRHGSH